MSVLEETVGSMARIVAGNNRSDGAMVGIDIFDFFRRHFNAKYASAKGIQTDNYYVGSVKTMLQDASSQSTAPAVKT